MKRFKFKSIAKRQKKTMLALLCAAQYVRAINICRFLLTVSVVFDNSTLWWERIIGEKKKQNKKSNYILVFFGTIYAFCMGLTTVSFGALNKSVIFIPVPKCFAHTCQYMTMAWHSDKASYFFRVKRECTIWNGYIWMEYVFCYCEKECMTMNRVTVAANKYHLETCENIVTGQ